jgi:hypothetical protein
LEEKKISDKDEQRDLKSRYKALGKKLKQLNDDTEVEIKEKLVQGLESVSSQTFLPVDMTTYLLSLKGQSELPVSILPASLFKRPRFLGREDFFYRLASELISFGLSYQRVFLQPVRLSKIAELFHIHRPWWQCDIRDIELAIKTLVKDSIVQETVDGYLFEPMTMSTEVQSFLNKINEKINDYGEIKLSEIYNHIPWNKSKIEGMINLLVSNKVCLFQKENQVLFFPGFKRG